MSTKICPNCNAEVPGVAHLCKHCFHDFHVVVPKKKSPLFTVLFLAVGTALVSAGVYAYSHSQNWTAKVSVDQETQSIVFTTTYADRTEADRVFWKDVSTIEYTKNTSPYQFEVAVVTVKGARHVYQQSNEPIDHPAQQLADAIKRPLVVKDEADIDPSRTAP